MIAKGAFPPLVTRHHAALQHELANLGRRARQAVRADLGNDRKSDAVAGAEIPQLLDLATSVFAEAEVCTDDDVMRADLLGQDLLDKDLGGHASQLCRERLDQNHLGPSFLQKLGPSLKRGEHGRRQRGRKEAGRVWIEGQGDHFTARRSCDPLRLLQQRLMPEVHAVEVPDGHGWFAQSASQRRNDAAASSNGLHFFRDTGQIPLRQLSSFSTSDPLSLQMSA